MAALPWAIVSWSIAGFSGYQIWHIDHPNESARSAVGVRVRWLATAAVTVGVVLILREVDPVWLVAGVVVWVLALVVLGLILGIANSEQVLADPGPTDGPTAEPGPWPAEGDGGEGPTTSEERAAEPEAP
ncbi:MAG TPA: hypothetical protein VIZ22_11620 [Candidatus Limnocylindrales bacterium]